MPPRRILAVLAALVMFLLSACQLTDEADRDEPVGATPGEPQLVARDAALHAARLDAAKRAGVDARDVRLRSVKAAGFDGCLGVTVPGQACTQQFLGGFIAIYDARGADYRYHFGGGKFLLADPARATVSDGLPVPAEIAPDLNAELAAYAREDLELRLARNGAVVTAILPSGFPNGCMGFLPQGQHACDDSIVEGAVVFLLGPDGKTYRYHVGSRGAIGTDFEQGAITFEPLASVRVVQQLMREDLARRLGKPVNEVGVASYRVVTWPDGCLGVHKDGQLCTQALVEGFLAILAGPDGKPYRYHGGPQGDFIAASFEATAKISEPLPAR